MVLTPVHNETPTILVKTPERKIIESQISTRTYDIKTPIPTSTPWVKEAIPYDEAHWKHIPLQGSILDKTGNWNDVFSIAIVSEKEVWAGTSYGLWKMEGDKTTNYTSQDILRTPQIDQVKVAPDGKVWWRYKLSVENTLTSWDRKKEIKHFPLNCKVSDFTFSKDGTMWAACSGITYYKDNTWHIIHLKDDNNEYGATSIVALDEKNLWVTTEVGGVFQVKNEQLTQFSRDFVETFDESGVYIYKLRIASDDTLWGIIFTTVFHFNGRNWENYRMSYPSGQTLGGLVISKDGTIWAGNGYMRNGKNYVFTNLPFYAIYDIQGAPDGSIWYGTQNGIYVYDNKQ
jgi:ligand-binding sensor domain-containing protein